MKLGELWRIASLYLCLIVYGVWVQLTSCLPRGPWVWALA